MSSSTAPSSPKTRPAADRGGLRGRLRSQHVRRPLRRRLRRVVRGRLRRGRRPSSGWRPWRGPAGGCSSWGRAADGWPCRSPDGASRCGRSTPRPPCSTGCGPGPAATGCASSSTTWPVSRTRRSAEGGGSGSCCARSTRCSTSPTPTRSGACLARVRDLLAPEGVLVVEAFVPPPGGEGDAAVAAVEPRHIGLDEVVLTVSRLDPATRTITGQHLQITERGVRLRPWVLHYADARRSSTRWPPARGCGWSSGTPGGGASRSPRSPRPTSRCYARRTPPTVTRRGDGAAGRNVAHPAACRRYVDAVPTRVVSPPPRREPAGRPLVLPPAMSQLRLNPLTGRWVTIAVDRDARPGDLISRRLPVQADPSLPMSVLPGQRGGLAAGPRDLRPAGRVGGAHRAQPLPGLRRRRAAAGAQPRAGVHAGRRPAASTRCWCSRPTTAARGPTSTTPRPR